MRRSSNPATIAHWSTLLEGVQASPSELYASVEAGIKERQVPNAVLSRVDWSEGGALTTKRQYLRVARGRYIVDICGAPFGTAFFVSSWLTTTQSSAGPIALIAVLVSLFAAIPISLGLFGWLFGLLFVGIGLPLLFWLFVQVMNAGREGWDDALVAMPLLGPIYKWVFRPDTYYRIDTAVMFQTAIHNAVLEAVDQLTSAKGLRALPETAREPTYRAF